MNVTADFVRTRGAERNVVSFRCFVLGLLLAAGLAALNSWAENVANVHFLSGVHLPVGSVFALLFLILVVNGPLKAMTKGRTGSDGILRPFSPTELLTVYVMTLFGSLVSTPGCDNFFLTTGASLPYFSTRENGWDKLFNQYLPKYFAPGWDGNTFDRQNVIDPAFLGGVKASAVPWGAWMHMCVAFSILLAFVYATLFFLSLLLRRQWIESEAIAFPLVQLPLQMVDVNPESAPKGPSFWVDKTMWGGAIIAFLVHGLRGMNNYFPDWPAIACFHGGYYQFLFPDAPWNAATGINIQIFFGAIGVAYLLTRELSFSFWFFYFMMNAELVLSTILGYPAASLPKDGYMNKPLFITQQSIGGWMMMGGLLLWAARSHFKNVYKSALAGETMEGEPFSARFVLGGLGLSVAGALGWCLFVGIQPLGALAFFTFFLVTSVVLARLVVEGGFIFPQTTYGGLESLTTTVFGAAQFGPASITKLTVLQPMFFADMRNNLLPGFLNTLKIAHSLNLDTRQTRRLLGAAIAAIAVGGAVSMYTTIVSLYSGGGLAGYGWFAWSGPKSFWTNAESLMHKSPAPSVSTWTWVAVGALIVWSLTMARARFLWFPLHPLAFIVCSGYPISRLWASFFLGWLTKALLLRFGGQDWANRVRPFMIGLILGNAVAMMFWMLFGFWKGTQIGYWPA